MTVARDLDLLGAEGLSGQYITLRVRSIDRQKLGQAVGGGPAAAVLPAALALVDVAPQETLSMLLPVVKERAASKYGVLLDYQVSAAPPAPGEPKKSGTGKAVLLGAALGGGGVYAAARLGLVDLLRGAAAGLRARVGL